MHLECCTRGGGQLLRNFRGLEQPYHTLYMYLKVWRVGGGANEVYLRVYIAFLPSVIFYVKSVWVGNCHLLL